MLHLEVTEVIKNYVVAKLLETVTLLIQTPVISVKPIDYYMYTLINNGNRRNKNNPNKKLKRNHTKWTLRQFLWYFLQSPF